MPKGYWIAHIDVTAPDLYPEYVRLNSPVFAEYGARFLVRGGESTVVEGQAGSRRHVVIEFPDLATAKACYDSPGYQEAAAIRWRSAKSEIIIVEGHA